MSTIAFFILPTTERFDLTYFNTVDRPIHLKISMLRSITPKFNLLEDLRDITAQKMKFSMKDLFSKCDQIRNLLRIWSHLLQKSFMENFIFFAVYKPNESFIWSLLTKELCCIWEMNHTLCSSILFPIYMSSMIPRQDVNWMYVRHSEDVLEVFWTSYVRSMYFLCLRGITVSYVVRHIAL